jgi:hypothetical protein
MEKINFPCKYPLIPKDYEFSRFPDLLRKTDFQPRRITVRKKNLKVFGGLIEFNEVSIIFDR